MPVQNSDIKFYHSTNKLGGPINLQQEVISNLLDTLFDPVTGLESANGAVDYRCIYVANKNQTDTLFNAGIYIDSVLAQVTQRHDIGLGSALNGMPEQTIPNDITAPSAVTFTRADVASPLVIGDMPPNDYKAIWIRRSTAAGAIASTTEQFSLTAFGETS